jgi:hypothetical protein
MLMLSGSGSFFGSRFSFFTAAGFDSGLTNLPDRLFRRLISASLYCFSCF